MLKSFLFFSCRNSNVFFLVRSYILTSIAAMIDYITTNVTKTAISEISLVPKWENDGIVSGIATGQMAMGQWQ